MVKTFETSPHKNTILRAIQNLLLTFDYFYFEAHLGIVYTAFEMLLMG